MEISAPHALVRLPRTTRPDAATYFGCVCAVREGMKRRRKEICAAVDGDSISIYEVQNGKILVSYPVPPTSHFLGQPCSIREKSNGKTLRKTYCAIKRRNLRIESFETCEGDTHRPTSNASSDLRNQQSPILLLETNPNKERKEILVVQQNGDLTIFSEDLKNILLEGSLCLSDQRQINILAIQHLTVLEAQKGILKRRSDVLTDATSGTSYFSIAYSTSGEQAASRKVCYAVWPIDISGPNAVSKGPSFYPVFEHELPMNSNEAKAVMAKHKSCHFSPSASNLYLRAGAAFLSYDLTHLVPSLSSVLHTGLSGSYEIMAISPAFAICSLEETFQLYDLKYSSIQVQMDPKRLHLKRKRNRMTSESQSGPIEFVTYFPQSARVVGRRRNQLWAVDISANTSNRVLKTGNQLVHSIGRGLSNQDTMTGPLNEPPELTIENFSMIVRTKADWQHVRRRLDQLAQAGDVAGFENDLVEDIRKGSLWEYVSSKTIDDLPSNRTAIPDSKINFLLSKIFQISAHVPDNDPSASPTRLKVQLPTFRLILWLSRLGVLSSRNVQRAVSNSPLGSGDSLPIHSVAQALIDVDHSRGLLVECLENGFSPYVEEQAAVVRLLIQQALVATSDIALSDTKDEVEPTNESSRLTELQVQKLSAPTSDPAWLPTQLQRALIAALDRFGTSASSTVSEILRSLFTQTEVLALIQFLRQQLFQGGHTRSFQNPPDSNSPGKASSNTVQLEAIVKILSSCIDAIGPLGFFGALDNEDFIGNIVPDLVTEITHTKQSLEDVAELQGILRETLRYQESMQKHKDAGARIPHQALGRASEPQPGTIVTLYSEAVEGGAGLQTGYGLPLGLRVENVVSPVKIRKGGGQKSKRSIRQMGMLERRQKGQYSFERLVL